MKIKVIHTKISTGETQESSFSSQGQWEQHPYFENEEWSNEVVDVTAEKELEAGLDAREKEMNACREVIKLVGHINKSKPEGTVISILTNQSMQGAIMALITGSPKTAKGLISQISTELYSVEEKDQVVTILDSVIPS